MGHPSERTVEALRRLAGTLRATLVELEALIPRAEALADELADGRDLGPVMDAERRPLVITLLTQVTDHLQEAGSEVRRAEARQLRSEGYTQERIAETFGVTRQRAAALLKTPPPAVDRTAGR